MPNNQTLFNKIFVLIFLIILVCVAFVSRYIHYSNVFESEKGANFVANDVYEFGKHCSYSIGKWNDNLRSLLQNSHSYKEQPLPLAWYMPPHERPRIENDEYIINKCSLELTSPVTHPPAWVSLGRIWGETFVYLNGSLRSHTKDSGDVTFLLLEGDIKENSVLEVISRLNEHSDGVAGFRGGSPLFVTNDRFALNRIKSLNVLEHVQTPLYWINVYLVLAFIATLAWILGLRYNDVAWFIVMTTTYSLYWLLAYSTDGTILPLQRTILIILNFLCYLSLPMFAYSYLRLTKTNTKSALLFILLGLLFTITYISQDPSGYLRLLLRRAHVWTSIGIMIPVIFIGIKALKRISDKKRKTRMSIFLFICILFIFAQSGVNSGLVSYDVAYAQMISEVLLIIYSSFFIADLIVFYRKNMTEKAKRIKARHKMEKATTMITLSEMMVHDVQRPFNLIKALLSMIESKKGYIDQELIEKVKFQVDKSIKELSNMTNEIRYLDKKESFNKKPCEISSLLLECLQQIQIAFKGQNISFLYQFNHTKKVDIDFYRVARAISNIIENAVHASGDKGQIWFKTFDHQNYVSLQIGNSGPLIPQDDLESLFSPFFTRKKRGKGLGLAIAEKALHDHEGKLTCTSNAHEGTFFCLDIPASREHSDIPGDILDNLPDSLKSIQHRFASTLNGVQNLQKLKTQTKSLDPSKINLLILDDDDIYLEYFGYLINDSHQLNGRINLRQASNSQGALIIYKNEMDSITHILTDFHLGENEVNGLEFIQQIKAMNDSVKCGIISNAFPIEMEEEARKISVNEIFRKPIKPEEISDFLELENL